MSAFPLETMSFKVGEQRAVSIFVHPQRIIRLANLQTLL
ncbi:hypothetical protein ICL07_22795 [Chitinophaga qingshengii]|uniref:Uncharacterized protein n=1 Tax=Chitinophaga qingshengii TaxID=1569794 RepID=A0ABR7TUY2_9BACT|nr:hypothetical protein [Chitinophaga qingshengii]